MRVSKGVLKAKMLEYFRTIEKTGEELIVTDHKRPVLRIVPFEKKISADELFADLRGKMKVIGDINEPASDLKEWEALK